MDGDLILKGVVALIGAGVSIYQLRQLMPKSRTQLKTDLEILKLLDPSDSSFDTVKAHIRQQLESIYSPPGRQQHPKAHKFDWEYFWIGTVNLILGFLGALYFLRNGFSWWVLITIPIGFIGLINFVLAFPRIRNRW